MKYHKGSGRAQKLCLALSSLFIVPLDSGNSRHVLQLLHFLLNKQADMLSKPTYKDRFAVFSFISLKHIVNQVRMFAVYFNWTSQLLVW